MDFNQSYNKYTNLPLLTYNIIAYLVNNNEEIWKLLKYSDTKALEKNNLTKEEKVALIFRGEGDANNFRLFSDWGIDDSVTKEIAILRISPLDVVPSNYVIGNCTIGFEIFVHSKINTLIDSTNRSVRIAQQLLETLNGSEIEDVGKLYFDSKTRNRIITNGQINFRGLLLTMSNFQLG
jgi:hypothetical protein